MNFGSGLESYPIVSASLYEAILVVGLPGSGKTTWARRYFENAVIVDDPRDEHDLIRGHNKVIARAENSGIIPLVVVDPHLTKKRVLSAAIVWLKQRGFRITICFFDNKPELCQRNRDAGDKATGRQLSVDVGNWSYDSYPSSEESALFIAMGIKTIYCTVCGQEE